MKRFFIILITLSCFCTLSSAQSTQRQKSVHMAAIRIASQIEVSDSDKDVFINLYQCYKKECALILSEKPAVSGDGEKDAEARILCDFTKSGKMLALRRTYYDKFRTILSPSQIQKMYDLERKMMPR